MSYEIITITQLVNPIAGMIYPVIEICDLQIVQYNRRKLTVHDIELCHDKLIG